jgi:hypothetical protein
MAFEIPPLFTTKKNSLERMKERVVSFSIEHKNGRFIDYFEGVN